MRALIKEKKNAIKLRKKGMSLNDICYKLNLGKGTVYPWIRNISVEIKRSKRSYNNLLKGTAVMQENYRKKREKAYNETYKKAEKLLRNKIIRDFIISYYCEGAKTQRHTICFVNTDSSIHKLFLKGVSYFTDKDFKGTITCHDNNEDLEKYWSKELNIPKEKIRYQIKKGNKAPNRFKYGTFTLKIHDTLAKAKINALMDYLLEEWNKL